MILEEVRIKNFRGYRTETIVPITDLTAFIGKNDAGKSSILESLEIFFNNDLVVCERDDLNISSDNNQIEITCVFNNLPNEIIIDAAVSTSLASEFLLNQNDRLEIKKVFTATAAKPKEKVYIICNHPNIEGANDLLELKKAELKARAKELGISQESFNGNINSTIRQAIWSSFDDLQLMRTELLVDKEDTKKVYDTIKNFLPIYALFQSDRQSKDDDKEVTDPMKLAVQQALSELTTELEYIKNEVRNKAIDTANRTLAKLMEMSPDLANELIPEFKTEPKFDTQFKLTINSENNIPINKRGSGVRRLILLNFFRAEAERLRSKHEGNQIIFAFEEPETSQHPDHQKMLIQAFIELSNSGNSQILLTTHTPSLAGLLPLNSLRFIEKLDDDRTIELGTPEVFEKIAQTLGILADPIPKNATAIILIEGKSDVAFINHTAEQLKNAGYLTHTFQEKRIALVPIGGCGNLKHWKTLNLVEQFQIPYCVLLDSDKGTNEEQKNIEMISELRQNGIRAYVTRKREPENYIHLDCLNLPNGSSFSFTASCDAKVLIANEKSTKKELLLEKYWTRMSADQIREVERYDENGLFRYEFSEMFQDFLNVV
jgi:putative ATP-dependent endonuclease of the OLD family